MITLVSVSTLWHSAVKMRKEKTSKWMAEIPMEKWHHRFRKTTADKQNFLIQGYLPNGKRYLSAVWRSSSSKGCQSYQQRDNGWVCVPDKQFLEYLFL